jgi:hypothetical protein
VLEPVIAQYRCVVKHLYFRGDAAFANPEVYEFLEAEGAGYTIRLPANQVLQDKIGYLLNSQSPDLLQNRRPAPAFSPRERPHGKGDWRPERPRTDPLRRLGSQRTLQRFFRVRDEEPG